MKVTVRTKLAQNGRCILSPNTLTNLLCGSGCTGKGFVLTRVKAMPSSHHYVYEEGAAVCNLYASLSTRLQRHWAARGRDPKAAVRWTLIQKDSVGRVQQQTGNAVGHHC